jgi:ABC-type antimicrobial peptide transport system permease subunit
MVLGQGLILVLAGLGIGLATALGLARVMRSLLYDVSPTDSGTFTAVVAVLTITALAACLVPALKASRIEPLIALRSD